MRIGILKESFCVGGTERSAANISKILSTEHDVSVMLYDARDIKYSFGGELINFNLPASRSILAKISNNLFRIIKYKGLIRKKKFDVLYEFISINNPISLLRHKSAVRIISARDFSVLEACTERFYRCLNNADAMICNSQYLRQYFVAKHPELSDKVFSVYNYIDRSEICNQSCEEIELQYNEFIAQHKMTIVSVGRFCKEKGFEYLIEAVARAREENDDIGLVLVGDGEYKQKYLDVIKPTGLENHVYFAGFQKNPYKYMVKCSCFVLSSLSEGFPNVLAEAMALGLPVIAANCRSGPAEILRDDSDYNAVTDEFLECDYGIISPQIVDGDNSIAIEQMSCAMLHLLKNDELMNKYSEYAKKRVEDFSQDAIKKKFEVIFKELRIKGVQND